MLVNRGKITATRQMNISNNLNMYKTIETKKNHQKIGN